MRGSEYTYLVTRGSYEDYTVVASFGADEAAAEAFATKLRGSEDDDGCDGPRVEKFKVRPAGWFGDMEETVKTYIDLDTGDATEPETAREMTLDFENSRPAHAVHERWSPRQILVISGGPVGDTAEAHAAVVAMAQEEIRPYVGVNTGTIRQHPALADINTELNKF